MERVGKIIQELATPAGIEGARNHAKPSETEPVPTEKLKSVSVSHIVARRGCSKCSKAAHLALVAANAVRNGDLYRALEILEEVAGVAAGPIGTRSQGRESILMRRALVRPHLAGVRPALDPRPKHRRPVGP